MAHECPGCGMVCDCDGEDTWNDASQVGCDCPCEALADDGEDE